ncbi:MAG: C45 family peptidase [Candidatus Thorarchaeota archaeon]
MNELILTHAPLRQRLELFRERSEDMKEFRVKGTYREMGVSFGKTLAQFHRNFTPNEKQLEFAQECEVAVRRFAPDILDEIKGISEVSETRYESLTSIMLAPWFLFGCTLFAVKGVDTANGSPIFVRQMDWYESDVDALHVIHSEPDDGHKSTGFSFGDCGRYGGQNETGLTIASAYAPNYTGQVRPGVRMNISTRWALDKFSTSKETVDYFLGIPHTEAQVFLVADGSGTIARVETSPEKSVAAYLDEGVEIVTNFFKLDEMRHLDKRHPDDNHVYDCVDRTEKWYEENRGSITTESIRKFCSDNDNGICRYSKDIQEATIWSWIAETNPVKIEIAPGVPCKTDYRVLE